MYRLLSLAAVGLATTALTLVTPEKSQAQYSPGISVQFGGLGFSSGFGGSCYRGSTYSYAPRYSTFGNSYYGSSFGGRSYGTPYYGGYNYNSYNYYRQPAVVHPNSLHWTPRRGLHTHGHVHVPHGNHYHTVPY